MPNISDIGNSESAFWQFSLAFYARPAVAGACLELQDKAGADVNILLYLLFLATHGRQLARADVAHIDTLVRAWRQQAVVPLRTLRRALKSGITPFPVTDTETLRSAVKRDELEAEHLEQNLLQRLAPASGVGAQATTRGAAARANLAAYGEFLNGMPAAAVEILLEAHVQAHPDDQIKPRAIP